MGDMIITIEYYHNPSRVDKPAPIVHYMISNMDFDLNRSSIDVITEWTAGVLYP